MCIYIYIYICIYIYIYIFFFFFFFFFFLVAGIDDYREVVTEVQGVSYCWWGLGVALRMPVGKLHGIKHDSGTNANASMYKMIEEWMHGNGDKTKTVSWETLLEALRHDTVGLGDEADRITAKITEAIRKSISDIN